MTLIDSVKTFFKLVLIKLFCYINTPIAIPLVYAEEKQYSRLINQVQ